MSEPVHVHTKTSVWGNSQPIFINIFAMSIDNTPLEQYMSVLKLRYILTSELEPEEE